MQLVKVSEDEYISNQTLTPEFVYCCQDVCSSVTNIVITKGRVGTTDGHSLISNLGVAIDCDATKTSCGILDGIIVWETGLEPPCAYKAKDWYEIQISGSHYIIPKIQGAFTSTKGLQPSGKNLCLPKLYLLTDQGPVISPRNQASMDKLIRSQSSSNNSKLHTRKRRKTFKKPNVETATVDPINFKLQFLEASLQNMQINDFRDVWLNLCNLAASHLQVTWQLLRLDATTGARVLLKRNGIYAKFVGSALMVWKCTPLNITSVYWDYKIENDCYALLPIKSSNLKIYFALPGSSDVAVSAPKVPCGQITHGIFFDKLKSKWFGSKGSVPVQNLTAEVIWKDHYPKVIFDAPMLITDKTALTGLATIQSTIINFQRLQAQFKHFVNHTSHMSVDPHILETSLNELGDGQRKILNRFRRNSLIGRLIDDVTGSDIVKFFTSGSFQTMLNLITAIAIIALIGYIMSFLYPYLKFCRFFCCFCCKRSSRNVQAIEMESIEPLNRRSPRQVQFAYAIGPSSHPTILVRINDIPCLALLDTGASVSLISDAVFEQLKDIS